MRAENYVLKPPSPAAIPKLGQRRRFAWRWEVTANISVTLYT